MDNNKLSQSIDVISKKVAELDESFFSLNREVHYIVSSIGQPVGDVKLVPSKVNKTSKYNKARQERFAAKHRK